jgi:hypothetical protein
VAAKNRTRPRGSAAKGPQDGHDIFGHGGTVAAGPDRVPAAGGTVSGRGRARSRRHRRRRPARSGRRGVVQLDVLESDQGVLDERQAGELLACLVRGGVVEQQDRAGAVGLEEDVFGDPALVTVRRAR